MDELHALATRRIQVERATWRKPRRRFHRGRSRGLYPLAATYDKAWEYTDEATGDYAVEEDGFTPKRVGDEQVVSGVKYEKAWIPMLAGVQDFYKRFQALAERVAVLESLLQEAE